MGLFMLAHGIETDEELPELRGDVEAAVEVVAAAQVECTLGLAPKGRDRLAPPLPFRCLASLGPQRKAGGFVMAFASCYLHKRFANVVHGARPASVVSSAPPWGCRCISAPTRALIPFLFVAKHLHFAAGLRALGTWGMGSTGANSRAWDTARWCQSMRCVRPKQGQRSCLAGMDANTIWFECKRGRQRWLCMGRSQVQCT